MFHWQKVRRFLTICVGDFLASSSQWAAERIAPFWLKRRGDSNPANYAAALLRQMPSPAVPTGLAFRVRARIGQERRKQQRATWSWRWRNRLAPFAVPAGVGLLSAILMFAIFVRIFEIPVQANSTDVPLMLRTPPRLLNTALLDTYTGIECMKVQILIDQNGRVADYSIIKGKQTPEQLRSLHYLLMFALFDPATVFGTPTTDTVTLHLRDGYLESVSL